MDGLLTWPMVIQLDFESTVDSRAHDPKYNSIASKFPLNMLVLPEINVLKYILTYGHMHSILIEFS